MDYERSLRTKKINKNSLLESPTNRIASGSDENSVAQKDSGDSHRELFKRYLQWPWLYLVKKLIDASRVW